MRAMLIPVDGLPVVMDIPKGLKTLQELVGGDIEAYGELEPGTTLWVNDDGVAACPPNRAIYATAAMAERRYLSVFDRREAEAGEPVHLLFGDIVAVGLDEATGGDIDLTDEQIRNLGGYFTYASGPRSGELELIRRYERGVDMPRSWRGLRAWETRKNTLLMKLDKPEPAAFGGAYVIERDIHVTEDDYDAVLPTPADKAMFHLLSNVDDREFDGEERREILAHRGDPAWLEDMGGEKVDEVESRTYYTEYSADDYTREEVAEMAAARPDLFDAEGMAAYRAEHPALFPRIAAARDAKYRYQLLSRLKSDCDYYTGACAACGADPVAAQKHLWAGGIEAQVAKMREIRSALPEEPEWLGAGDIDRYEAQMLRLRDGISHRPDPQEEGRGPRPQGPAAPRHRGTRR